MKTKVIIIGENLRSKMKFIGQKGYIDSYLVVLGYVKAIVVTDVGISDFYLEDLKKDTDV